jgi:hypothetical protein
MLTAWCRYHSIARQDQPNSVTSSLPETDRFEPATERGYSHDEQPARDHEFYEDLREKGLALEEHHDRIIAERSRNFLVASAFLVGSYVAARSDFILGTLIAFLGALLSWLYIHICLRTSTYRDFSSVKGASRGTSSLHREA